VDPKKRTILVVAITITIIAGLIASFGIPIFFQTSNIMFPDMSDDTNLGEQSGEPNTVDVGNFIPISVTTETVQEVIRTLHRKDSYYRELTIERFWGPNADKQRGTNTVLIWNDGDAYSKIMISDGSMKNILMAEGKKYVWYGSEKKWAVANDTDIDIVQNIPTYRDVLDLDPNEIIQADYETKSGENCIFVETFIEELGYLERYWISTESGLLIASETVKKETGALTYRMEENRMTNLEADTNAFMLPDGTVLHRVVGSQAEE
jgi:FlaG/FlaF family flagellin (archaellin)